MPELPEVETVARGLQREIAGYRIEGVRVFRENPITPWTPQRFAQALIGSKILQVSRRAKFLLFELEPRLWMIGHLRMTGKFIVAQPRAQPEKYDRVWFELEGERHLIFHDVRCFGTLEIVEDLAAWELQHKLGMEPFTEGFTAAYLRQAFAKSQRPIKPVLLDQSLIAGIGNIYASEILFAAGVSPLRPACEVKPRELERIQRATREILQASIDKHGTSISDFRLVDDKTGEFQQFLKVYDKAESPCSRCSTPIQRLLQHQRSTFFCPHCQK